VSTLHEDQYTYLLISCQIFRTMRNVSDKSCTENQNTHLMLNSFILFPKIVPFMRRGEKIL